MALWEFLPWHPPFWLLIHSYISFISFSLWFLRGDKLAKCIFNLYLLQVKLPLKHRTFIFTAGSESNTLVINNFWMSCNIYAGNLKLHVMFEEMKHREKRLHFQWTSAVCSVWHGTASALTRTWEQQLLSCHYWGIWNSSLDLHKEWAVISSQPSPSSLPFARLFYVKYKAYFFDLSHCLHPLDRVQNISWLWPLAFLPVCFLEGMVKHVFITSTFSAITMLLLLLSNIKFNCPSFRCLTWL